MSRESNEGNYFKVHLGGGNYPALRLPLHFIATKKTRSHVTSFVENEQIVFLCVCVGVAYDFYKWCCDIHYNVAEGAKTALSYFESTAKIMRRLGYMGTSARLLRNG